MRTLLFVCTANVCRSPMAEAIFNALAEDAGLPVRAKSAGLAALHGAPAASRAVQALEEIGVPLSRGRAARQIDESMVADADVVLAMTPQQTVELRKLFEHHAHKIHALAEYAGRGSNLGVPDPYGHPQAAFRASARTLLEHLKPLVSLIGKDGRKCSERSLVTGKADRTP